jgi:tetratricopeptide (TPR) repeat protein/TolB-like protein
MVGDIVSKYRILSKLGEGGMGEVYLAEDTELNRKVALKFLPEELASNTEALARFKREAQTAAALNHPNIVTVHEVGQHGKRPYIAMAYVDGEPLSDLIGQGALSVDRVVEITLQILDALKTAHAAGIVHRDIKPGNVFIDREGRVKLLDFGLAKPGGAGRLTGELSTMGTVFYMSPEQTRGEEVDQRSDLFSLGAVLYELLAGRPPFEGEHIAAVVYSITNEEPKPLSRLYQRVPRAMELVAAKALAKNPDDRYQSAEDMAADLRRIRAGLRPLASGRNRRVLKFALPTTAVFAAVLLLLVFKPFVFQVSRDQPALAAENTLAVMYFDNVADPEDPRRLGQIATDLLITDLSEFGNMNVISSQRLYDILKSRGKEGVRTIDRDTATDVAREAKAKWMLTGSILQEEPSLIMTSNLVDVETGRVVASQRITGESGEPIFALVDQLTREIRSDLSLPAVARSGRDVPIAEVTTHSTEAYRYYLEGMEHLNKYYGQEAKAAFDKALELDSTFAMVQLRLASSIIPETRAEKKQAINQAMRHAESVSQKERHYIRSTWALYNGNPEEAMAELEAILVDHPNEKDAYRALGDIYRSHRVDLGKAVENYRKVIEIDPLDKFAYNQLAYAYQEMGDIDNYIWAIYQYMALAPDEANPYDSRADLYAYSGKVDKAIESYEEALKRKPDFYPSIVKLGHMHLFKRQYEEALRYFRELAASPDPNYRSQGRTMEILIPYFQGRLGEAVDVADRAIAADAAEGYFGELYFAKQFWLVQALCVKGDHDRALKTANRTAEEYKARNPEAAWYGTLAVVMALAFGGETDKAEKELEAIKKDLERADHVSDYWFIKGMIAGEIKGDYAAAVEALLKARSKPGFETECEIGIAYFKAGRPVDAVNQLEKILRKYSEDRAMYAYGIRGHYYLARAQEELGHTGDAAAQYEEFLAYWGNGDPAIDEIADAKARLAAIRQPG